MSVVLIDYGMGNLGSVRRAFEECGADVRVARDPAEARGASALVLPGVGSFSEGMKNLNERGWPEEIARHIDEKRPFLGICLGMQLLASRGEEGGECKGLSLIGGRVKRMEVSSDRRLPHIGWNEVRQVRESPLFRHIPDLTDFYFVHSFHFFAEDEASVLSRTPYGENFVSCVHRDGVVFGTQFHPEKSQRPGFQLIQNFLERVPC